MQYRRIPFASGLSPSELLNGRIRTKIDTLVPSIPHLLQGRQSRQASKHSNAEDSEVVSKVEHHYSLGDPCYALYFGPRRDREAPYHPATNGAAERLIQSFKQALRKSSLPPKEALQEFLMQYRRILFASGLSPSELLNGRIRTKIDTLVPSIPHLLQGRQSRQASKHSNAEDSEVVSKVEHHYSLGDPCYALYFGPRRDRDPRWVPAIVTKVHGTRSVNVRVIPRGPTWRRHLDQLRPRYGSDQDDDPCEIPTSV